MAEKPISMSERVKCELNKAGGNVVDFQKILRNSINEWKETPLNIAVTGTSGVGKSSFINAIRGMTADDKGGAPVGVVETTREIKRYEHPSNNNMVFWDLPGVGTPNFPKNSYLKQVQIEQYDFYLLLSAGRFREDDFWLAKEIRGLKKNFHFIRTHMEVEVENDKKAHPNTHSEQTVIKNVRSDCLENLKDHDLKTASIFLIDNYSPKDFDFGELLKILIEDSPDQKREAMVLSLSVLTEDIIDKKVEALRERLFKVSLQAAIGAAIPIPGVAAATDMFIVVKEVAFYKGQLGLDDAAIQDCARYFDIEVSELQQRLDLDSVVLASTVAGLLQRVSLIAASQTFESTLPVVIPIIGSIVSVGISYGLTSASLKSFLDILSKDARKIHTALLKKSLKQAE